MKPRFRKPPRRETVLAVRIGNVEHVARTKDGKLHIEIYDHDPCKEIGPRPRRRK